MVAYGEEARREARGCVRSVTEHARLPVALVAERPGLGEACWLQVPAAGPGARLAKLAVYDLTPYDETAYLDADTRVRGSLDAGFRALEAGWELVLTPSSRQGSDALGNCPPADREATFAALGTADVLALQAGVFWWRRCDAVARLFARWRAEFGRFGPMDQGALLRALAASPVRVWLLGRAFNGGKVVEHRFGRAARRDGRAA